MFFSFKTHFNFLTEQKTMYCDRSAYYQKAIKATARRLKITLTCCGFFCFLGDYSYYSILKSIKITTLLIFRTYSQRIHLKFCCHSLLVQILFLNHLIHTYRNFECNYHLKNSNLKNMVYWLF